MNNLDKSFQTLTSSELEVVDGGVIPLLLIYAGFAVGGFVAGVGITVGTVKFLNWINA